MSSISKFTFTVPISDTKEKEPLIDPAEYLFQQTENHDCHFVVGDSDTGKFEKIGAVSSLLLAHSSKFREIFADKNLDKANISVTSVSPEVFRLMLTHMYGGELPVMDRSTAAQLALCADMYNIQPLVTRACKRLVPEGVDELFPALWCVAYVSCPNLESHVTKIIQEETEAVMESKEFLELDSECLDVIAQQEKLAVTELELWKGLVKWAEHKAQGDPGKTLRQYLESTLQFVRLTTLSQDEIITEVMPKKILTPTEVMELLTAVTSNQPWEFPGLCKIQAVREMINGGGELVKESGKPGGEQSFQTSCVFNVINAVKGYTYTLQQQPDYAAVSILTINTVKPVEIQTFTFKSKSIMSLGNQPIYKLSCSISISKTEAGFCKETRIIQVGGSVVGDEEIAFPFKLRNGQPLRLEAKSSYIFALEFSTPHPVYKIYCNNGTYPTHDVIKVEQNMTIKFNTLLHLQKMEYKV